jgi:hypothetical protein
MKKLLLTLMLVVVSSSAMAEWAEVGWAEDGNATFYADPATIRKSSNKVKMWNMLDYKIGTVIKLSYQSYIYVRSLRRQTEYDCKEEKQRILYVDLLSGNMGSGETVFTAHKEDDWVPIPHGAANLIFWKIACGK